MLMIIQEKNNKLIDFNDLEGFFVSENNFFNNTTNNSKR